MLLLRSKEIPVLKRSFETFKHNDVLFMKMMQGDLRNIFKTIMQINSETLK